MQLGNVNYLAVFVAAAVSFMVVPLWYGPLFGKAWTELTGITGEEGKRMGLKSLSITFIGFVMLAYGISWIMSYGGLSGIWWGGMVAMLVWITVIAPLMLSQTLYQNQPVKLWAIDAGFRMVTILIKGLIIGLWS